MKEQQLVPASATQKLLKKENNELAYEELAQNIQKSSNSNQPPTQHTSSTCPACSSSTMETTAPMSPASTRKQQTKIVSLFTKLMTPTKKEEEAITRVEVQQLGEEVGKLRKLIEMHEGLMKREPSTPSGKVQLESSGTQAPSIVTNLMDEFTKSEVQDNLLTPSKPSNVNESLNQPTPRATPVRNTPARVSVPFTPSTHQQQVLSTPLPAPATRPPPSTPLATSHLGPHSTPATSTSVLVPLTPAQLVPSTPTRLPITIDYGSSAENSNSDTSFSSDSDLSFRAAELESLQSDETVESSNNASGNGESSAAEESGNPRSARESLDIVMADNRAVYEKVEVVPVGVEAMMPEKVEIIPVMEQPVLKVVEAVPEKVEDPKKEASDTASLTALELQVKEIMHENKMLKGLVVRKDTDIRDLKHQVTDEEQMRKAGEARLNEITQECDSLRMVLAAKNVEIKEKEIDIRVKEVEIKAQATEIEEHYKPLAVRLSEANNERKALFNQVLELKGNIRVFCRVRPLTPSEAANAEKSVASFPVEGSVIIQNKKYDFDRVFEPEVDQAAVFVEVQPLIVSVMDGYNVCLFCYGQTGSGKTWTMEGMEGNRGINFRALGELFRTSETRSLTHKYTVSVSVLEIYNENVRDLLCSEQGKKLDIRTGSNGVVVPELSSHKVSNMEEVLALMTTGASNRAVGTTNQNEHSSRSHCIVCVTVSGENLATGVTSTARLHLVDLAGSERLSKTQAEGERLKEAQHINKSLSALGEVVNHLVSKTAHVPYRNSKLTHLLMDCLGGDSKTLMFVHINPSDQSVSESVCSLNFASRARSVENGQAKRHTDADYVKILGQAKKKDETIEQLKAQLKAAEEKATKAEEKYRNLAMQREIPKPLMEITNNAPLLPASSNFVSILRDNPTTPGKRSAEIAKPTFDPSSSLVSKENSENGEEKGHTNSRVRFAEESKNAPERKRLRAEPPSTPTSLSASLPTRSQPNARLASLRSTRTDSHSSPLKSANWNNSLRGSSKVPSLPPPKRNPIRNLATSSTLSSTLPQRGKKI